MKTTQIMYLFRYNNISNFVCLVQFFIMNKSMQFFNPQIKYFETNTYKKNEYLKVPIKHHNQKDTISFERGFLNSKSKFINMKQYSSKQTLKNNISEGKVQRKKNSLIKEEKSFEAFQFARHDKNSLAIKQKNNTSTVIDNKNKLKDTTSTNTADFEIFKMKNRIPSFFKQIRSKKIPDSKVNQGFGYFRKQNFILLKKLGEGKFGKVFMVLQIKTGMIMAMKVLEKKRIKSQQLMNQFIREIKLQSYLHHPGIISIYGIFHDLMSIYIIMELGCDGHLYHIIQRQRLSEESVSYITKSLLTSVGYMHEKNIIHRDIKPQNILLIHGTVKLCDFGWVVYNKDENMRETFCGTPLYLSPELLSRQPYGQKVDLWSIGILVYELYFGQTPFRIKEKKDIQKIVTEEVCFPLNPKASKQLKDFILLILEKNPSKRLNHKELLRLKFISKYKDLQTCEQLCQ